MFLRQIVLSHPFGWRYALWCVSNFKDLLKARTVICQHTQGTEKLDQRQENNFFVVIEVNIALFTANVLSERTHTKTNCISNKKISLQEDTIK